MFSLHDRVEQIIQAKWDAEYAFPGKVSTRLIL